MTFEDFHRLNKEQIARLIEAKAWAAVEKLCWNEGFRMGYGAAYFIPKPEKEGEK